MIPTGIKPPGDKNGKTYAAGRPEKVCLFKELIF